MRSAESFGTRSKQMFNDRNVPVCGCFHQSFIGERMHICACCQKLRNKRNVASPRHLPQRGRRVGPALARGHRSRSCAIPVTQPVSRHS